MSTFLLTLAALASGLLLAHRVLRERDPLLIGALAPLVGAALVLMGANFGAPFAAVVPLLALAFVKGPPLQGPSNRSWLLGLSAAAVLLYTHYAQMRFLDTDNWIHEPLIASYIQGLFPPRNPFFPELTLNGHYGRDLLVAVLTPRGRDPLGTVWVLNPVLQLAGFLALFASLRAVTGRFGPALLAAVLMFFGACVGIRVGLADTFDGNNGVVYALLILNLHLLFRLFRPADPEAPRWTLPATWVVAGAVLGIYQVVYETHFGLLLLTGATLGLVFREKRAWAALLVAAAVALPMAAVEGGPITDLVQRRGQTDAVHVVQNQSQRVSVKFPKEHLFQVLATDSTYQRTSVAYQTRLFAGLYRAPQGSGYMSIFDPRFLTTHWLPLYLAPLSLWTLWRRRSLPGLALWFFGAWSYLVPGLVDFGSVYEWEYFRWEFAAGVAFAGALGMALAEWLKPLREGLQARRTETGWDLQVQRSALKGLVAGLVLVAALAAGQKMLNGAIIDVQTKKPPLFTTPGHWRTLQPDLRVTEADLQAARWLQERVVPGERFLSNRAQESPTGIWADVVIATLSGARPAGHAYPPGEEGTHAGPPYYRDAVSRAFWATGRTEMLAPAGIRWVFADLTTLSEEARQGLQALKAGPVFGETRQVFEVPAREPQATGPGLEFTATLPEDMRVGTAYEIPVTVRNPTDAPVALGAVTARVLDAAGEPTRETPLLLDYATTLPAGAETTVKHVLVTPLDEGTYQYELGESRTPFNVDFLTRLKALKPRLDLPDGFRPRQFYRVRLGLTSDAAVRDDVEFYFRLKRPGGEYVWELDSIPQPLALDLQPGVEQETFFQMLTPEPGAYELELWLKDLRTGRTVRLGEPARIGVGEPG